MIQKGDRLADNTGNITKIIDIKDGIVTYSYNSKGTFQCKIETLISMINGNNPKVPFRLNFTKENK